MSILNFLACLWCLVQLIWFPVLVALVTLYIYNKTEKKKHDRGYVVINRKEYSYSHKRSA